MGCSGLFAGWREKTAEKSLWLGRQGKCGRVSGRVRRGDATQSSSLGHQNLGRITVEDLNPKPGIPRILDNQDSIKVIAVQIQPA